MGIRFDSSSCTVLAVCDQCEWLDLVLDASTARRRALDHTWTVHPTDQTTLNTLQRWRSREAAGGGN